MAKPKKVPVPSDEDEAIRRKSATMALFQRAMKGDKSCRAEFDALLDLPGHGPELVDLFGNVAGKVQSSLVERVAGPTNLAARSAIPRKLERLRAELEGPSPNAIERLLAERAVYGWLVVWQYESALVHAPELTNKQSEFHQRRIDAAHRRFLSAVRTLAQVRKLGIPSIQVNIGQNQVNVTG
jgi:hypothetical protein